jgi:hypothetical protein
LGAILGAAVAMDGTGAAAATWLAGGAPMAAVRDAGGGFGAAQPLGSSGASAPRVALDGSGGALAVWVADGLLRASERSAGGGFTTLPAVAAAMGAPEVAFLGDGTAVVAYRGADGQARVALRAPGGAFVFPAALSSEAGVEDPRVAAAGSYAVVTWTARTRAGTVTTSRASAAVLTPGGGFGAPQVLATATEDSADPGTGSQVSRTVPTIGPSGAADVIVSSSARMAGGIQETCSTDTIWTRAAGTGGAWTSSAGGGSCTADPPRAVDLAAGRAGDALLVIGTGAFTPTIAVTSRMRPAGAAAYTPGADVFSGPAAAQSASLVRVAPLSTGRYLVAFTRDRDLLATAGWPVYGFEAPATVASNDANQLVGLASSTNEAVLAWVSSGQLRVALYDDRSVTPLAAAVALVLSRLSLSPRRFSVARGTTIGWRLSAPARITFRVDRVRGGFRRAATCSARRPRSGRVRRCTRYVRVGSFTRSAHAGDGSLRFSGVVSRRALRPGHYRLVAIATDAARHSSRAQRALFTVVRR